MRKMTMGERLSPWQKPTFCGSMAFSDPIISVTVRSVYSRLIAFLNLGGAPIFQSISSMSAWWLEASYALTRLAMMTYVSRLCWHHRWVTVCSSKFILALGLHRTGILCRVFPLALVLVSCWIVLCRSPWGWWFWIYLDHQDLFPPLNATCHCLIHCPRTWWGILSSVRNCCHVMLSVLHWYSIII